MSNVSQQLHADAQVIARGLMGDTQPGDSIPVSKATNAEYIKWGWGNPLDPADLALPEHVKFRNDLLDRVGPEQMWQQAHDAFGVKPVPDQELSRLLGITMPDPLKVEPKVTSVKTVERDGAGRITRIVDQAAEPPQVAPELPPEPASPYGATV